MMQRQCSDEIIVSFCVIAALRIVNYYSYDSHFRHYFLCTYKFSVFLLNWIKFWLKMCLQINGHLFSVSSSFQFWVCYL